MIASINSIAIVIKFIAMVSKRILKYIQNYSKKGNKFYDVRNKIVPIPRVLVITSINLLDFFLQCRCAAIAYMGFIGSIPLFYQVDFPPSGNRRSFLIYSKFEHKKAPWTLSI